MEHFFRIKKTRIKGLTAISLSLVFLSRCVCVCVYQREMANGGDQFGLSQRPDSDCMDPPKETKQENPSYTLNSPASPHSASNQQADQNVN